MAAHGVLEPNACFGVSSILSWRAGGSLTRAKDQARIDFLAQARNRALEPLWLNNSMATSTSLLLPHDPEVSDSSIAAESFGMCFANTGPERWCLCWIGRTFIRLEHAHRAL